MGSLPDHLRPTQNRMTDSVRGFDGIGIGIDAPPHLAVSAESAAGVAAGTVGRGGGK